MPEDLKSVRAERDELARAALSVLKDLDALLDGRNKDHKPLLWQEYARMRQELREALAYRAEGPDGVEERESIARAAVDALDLSARDARVRAQVAEEIAASIEDNVRNEDWSKQDRGGFYGFAPKMAYVAGHDKAAEIARAHAVSPSAQPAHRYLSTACWHGQYEPDPSRAAELHGYCAGTVRLDGETKVPAKCKFCDAKCSCACHREEITEEQP